MPASKYGLSAFSRKVLPNQRRLYVSWFRNMAAGCTVRQVVAAFVTSAARLVPKREIVPDQFHCAHNTQETPMIRFYQTGGFDCLAMQSCIRAWEMSRHGSGGGLGSALGQAGTQLGHVESEL
ncbi:hypothetical protein ACJZ2D_016652 [Fusarium nematophilum]